MQLFWLDPPSFCAKYSQQGYTVQRYSNVTTLSFLSLFSQSDQIKQSHSIHFTTTDNLDEISDTAVTNHHQSISAFAMCIMQSVVRPIPIIDTLTRHFKASSRKPGKKVRDNTLFIPPIFKLHKGQAPSLISAARKRANQKPSHLDYYHSTQKIDSIQQPGPTASSYH